MMLFAILFFASYFVLARPSAPDLGALAKQEASEQANQPKEVVAEKPLTLEGFSAGLPATPKGNPTRQFDRAGLSFEYPSRFEWDVEFSDPETKLWKMTGDDCVIMVFSMSKKVNPEGFARALAYRARVGQRAVVEINGQLHNREVKSYRVASALVKPTISREVYDLSSQTNTRLIIIYDYSANKSKKSAEAAEVYDYLNKSLTYSR